MKMMATPEILVRARNAFKIGEFPAGGKARLANPGIRAGIRRRVQSSGKRVREDGSLPQGHRAVPESGGAEARLHRGAQQSRGHLQAHRVLRRGDSPLRARHRPLAAARRRVLQPGQCLQGPRERRPAEENFAKAIAVEPGFVPSYINLGTVMEAAGRFGDAIRIYQKGLQADSDQPRLHYNLGVVYERIGKLTEAREEYEAAVRQNRAGPTRSTTSAWLFIAWVTSTARKNAPRHPAHRAEKRARPQQSGRRPGRWETRGGHPGVSGVDKDQPALRSGRWKPRLAPGTAGQAHRSSGRAAPAARFGA